MAQLRPIFEETMVVSQLLKDEAQIVRTLPFLSTLSEPEVDHIVASVRRRIYRKGDHIQNEDDLAGDCFIVIQGHVKHRLTALDGRQITHKYTAPGNFFGTVSLHEYKRRAGDAVAATDCELLVIDRETIVEVLRVHPEANAAFVQAYTQGLRHLLGLLHDFAFLNVPMRLAKVLLEHAQEDADVLYIPAYLNQMELAFLVATTRESVNQTLKRFAREGWVRLDHRILRISDPDGLRRSISA
jgi:CRP/FNR family cyclic AMP-dependent transcriptional regulator